MVRLRITYGSLHTTIIFHVQYRPGEQLRIQRIRGGMAEVLNLCICKYGYPYNLQMACANNYTLALFVYHPWVWTLVLFEILHSFNYSYSILNKLCWVLTAMKVINVPKTRLVINITNFTDENVTPKRLWKSISYLFPLVIWCLLSSTELTYRYGNFFRRLFPLGTRPILNGMFM